MAFRQVDNSLAYTLIDRRTGLQSGLICTWSAYLTRVLRPNSARDYLRDVALLLEWAEDKGISLAERFARLEGLSQSEIAAIGSLLATNGDGGPASANTFNRRLAAVAEFIGFHMERYLERCNGSISKSELAVRRIKRIEKTLARMKKSQAEVSLDEKPTRALASQELERLISIAHPSSDKNPFRSDVIRHRNFCMLLVSIEGLLRRSELALMEVDDFESSHSPTIRIKKPSNVNLYVCRDSASLKTRGRLVPISANLSHWLETYVSEKRHQLKKRGILSNALFLSEKSGRRISTSTVNEYLRRLSEAYKKAYGERIDLHSHMLRVTGATLLKMAADENISHEAVFSKYMETQEILSYVGGWSRTSRMPKHYSRQATADKVERIRNAKK